MLAFNILVRALIFCTFLSESASAYEVHEDKSCIEGVQFEINRVRQLIIETELQENWGAWQAKNIKINIDDLPSSCVSHEKLSLAYSGRYDWESSDDVHYKKIREKEPFAQNYLKQMIAARLNISSDNIADYIRPEYTYYKADVDTVFNSKPGNIVNLHYQFRLLEQTLKVTKEYWQNRSTRAQNVLESSICHPVNHQCLDSEDKLFLGKYPLSRPCWKQQVTYSCATSPLDGCKDLIEMGCNLYNSTCHQKYDSICLQWRRHYLCVTEGIEPEEEPNNRTTSRSRSHPKHDAPIPLKVTKEERKNHKSLALPKQKSILANSSNSQPLDDDRVNMKGKTASHESAFQKYKSISPNTGSTSSSNANTKGASTTAKGVASKGSKDNIMVARSINIDPNFLISEGTYIPCSLTTSFVSDVAGSIQCVISKDVYSSSGNVKLIERGTKAIGVYQSGILQHGAVRMFVLWTKLITPDHKRINLVDTQVVGLLGEAGISGRIDSHFLQRFGGALMVSIVKDLVQHATQKNSKQQGSTININQDDNTKDSFTSIVEKMLENSINIPPTMYKKQGDIVGILVGRDIDFSKIYKLQGSK